MAAYMGSLKGALALGTDDLKASTCLLYPASYTLPL